MSERKIKKSVALFEYEWAIIDKIAEIGDYSLGEAVRMCIEDYVIVQYLMNKTDGLFGLLNAYHGALRMDKVKIDSPYSKELSKIIDEYIPEIYKRYLPEFLKELGKNDNDEVTIESMETFAPKLIEQLELKQKKEDEEDG